jgi:hypothetical protein
LKGAVPPTRVNISLRLATATGMVEKDLRAVQRSVHDKVADYLASLPAKDGGSVNRLIGIVQSVNGVQDVKVLSVTEGGGTPLATSDGTLGLRGLTAVLGDLQITDPSLPTSLDVIATCPKDQLPADQAAMQQAWNDTVSYINTLNAAELAAGATAAEQNKRKLSFGKLLLATPLPNKPAVTLASFDNPSGAPPTLPTDASISPYKIQFVFTSESGFSRILAKSTDPDYMLSPLERLTVNSVQVQVEDSGA